MTYEDRNKDVFLGKFESVAQIFKQCGFRVIQVWELPNQYLPNHNPYDQEFIKGMSELEISGVHHYQMLRRANPWWLVLTTKGLIEIGRRKRVISIDWEQTQLRMPVTKDDVTSSRTYVHAWTDEKMFEYLRTLADLLYDYKTEKAV